MLAILNNADVLALFHSISNMTFWIALIALNLILLIISNGKYHITKLMLTIALIAILWTSIVQFTIPQIILSVIGYLLLGFIYSTFKWLIHIKNIVRENTKLLYKFKINDLNKIFNIQYKLNGNESDVKSLCEGLGILDIEACIKSRYTDANKLREIESDIKPSNNTDLFYTWIVYWPWSLVKEFTFNLFENIFEYTKAFYVNLVNKVLKNNIS